MVVEMDAVIIDAVRTPVGKLRGVLSAARPDDLGAYVIEQLLRRNPDVSPGAVEEVFFGCANQAGEDNRNVARMALLLAGLPEHVPGVTVNRLCASGLEAAVQAARAIRLGDMELCIAGGVESMTRAPWALMKPGEGFSSGSLQSYDTALGWRFPNPRMQQRFPLESMGETAENVAAKYRIAREKQDEFALRSHQRALAAREAGRYRAELLPVIVPGKQPVTVDRDEGPRADTSLEKLAKLKPAFREGGTVTAGNSSGLNDGAATILLASARKAAELGLEPLGRIVAAASAGVDPREMGMGPVPATHKALKNAGLSVKQLDLVELNEAFAAQSLAVIQELGLDPEKVNVDGGAIALGHPLGMSGARILGHLAHALKARGGKYGLATLCVGVGQGVSVIVESI
ncbi:MAG: thiolase family protein [Deltaproteobacteria bacterium]|nr:MAG: thiolase family protein [Deltaproteobacteria bacterium]TMB12042.1 MAG: thiolase family protein [Deltaproteobacteria bacterium]